MISPISLTKSEFYKKLFWKILNFNKPIKTRTLDETIEFINKSYHFNEYDENLVSEIYTLLLPYGDVNVVKNDEHDYFISVISTDLEASEVSTVKTFTLVQDGLKTN